MKKSIRRQGLNMLVIAIKMLWHNQEICEDCLGVLECGVASGVSPEATKECQQIPLIKMCCAKRKK